MNDLTLLYLPSARQIERWCDDLRIMATRVGPDGLTELDRLQIALVKARKRADGPSPGRDGYPTGTGGGAGGHRVMVIDDEAIPVTSVEAVALANATDDPVPTDHVHVDTEVACDMLRQGRDSLRAAVTRMNHLHRVTNPKSRGETSGLGECQGCGQIVTGSADDRLKRGLGPCCYSTWRRRGCPDMAVFKRDRRLETA